MSHYEDESIQFDVPRDWLDRTIVAYSAPLRPGQDTAANLVLTRQELEPDDTLQSYAERHVDQVAERMDAFEIVDFDEREIGGRPAIACRVMSESPTGSFAQVLAMVELPGRIVASFTLTSAEVDAAGMEPLFDRILSTVKVGQPAEEEPA